MIRHHVRDNLEKIKFEAYVCSLEFTIMAGSMVLGNQAGKTLEE